MTNSERAHFSKDSHQVARNTFLFGVLRNLAKPYLFHNDTVITGAVQA